MNRIVLILILALCFRGFVFNAGARVVEEPKMVILYEDFGAKGDGKTDDIDAIVKAHEYANANNLPVKANDKATYYIGGRAATAVIQTDTDFGAAKFIIDDTAVENRGSWVFKVESKLEPVKVQGVKSLKENQKKLPVSLPGRCLLKVFNSNVKNYIRRGANQNNGKSLTDVFIADADGNVDMSAPIIWDFETVTDISAKPIDDKCLKITGGRFTTIANRAESKYTYHARGISVRRSNVEIAGLEHYIKGEGDHGAPYSGFLNIADCADVTVRDSVFTGHKTYRTIGSAGRPVSMGSYDLHATRAVNVSFINCRQSNDIKNRSYWGIMASNYSKNLLYDGCKLSRFDAHMGVCNAAVRNSTLGHMGLNAIGHGLLTVENSTIYGRSFINMRSDYGSTWKGEFVIRKCLFVPACGGKASAVLIGGSNDGQHDFGYTCYLPERVTIEDLTIDDSNHPNNYKGPVVFAEFNPKVKNSKYVEKHPMVRPKEVVLKNVVSKSGMPIRLTENKAFFSDTKLIKLDE